MRNSSPIKSFGWLTPCTVLALMLAGCSRDDSASYTQYRSAEQVDQKSKPADEAVKPKAETRKQAPVPTNSASAQAVDQSLPAAIGPLSLSFWKVSDDTQQETVTAAAFGSSGSWLTIVPDPAGMSDLKSANPAIGANPGAKKPVLKPRKMKLLVKDKSFQVVGPEDAVRVSYDDINLLKVLNMEPVPTDAPKHMPKWMKDLHGKRIRIRGFMSPSYKATGLTAFLMGRDNQVCCYPGNAKVYDLFPVKMRNGVTTRFILNQPFDVVGVFEIKPWCEDGDWMRLYQITDAVIIQ